MVPPVRMAPNNSPAGKPIPGIVNPAHYLPTKGVCTPTTGTRAGWKAAGTTARADTLNTEPRKTESQEWNVSSWVQEVEELVGNWMSCEGSDVDYLHTLNRNIVLNDVAA